MKIYINILDILCCTSLTVILVSLAILVVMLLCKVIVEAIDDWRYEHANMRSRRRLSSLDDER